MKPILRCLIPLCFTIAVAPGAAETPVFAELSSAGDRLVLGYREGPIELLAVPDLTKLREIRGADGTRLEGVALSGSGRWLAADYGRGLQVWDLQSGEQRFTIPAGAGSTGFTYMFHPTEDLLYLSAGGELELWDPLASARIEAIEPIRAVDRMSISPEGRYLLVAGSCSTGCGHFDLCLWGTSEHLILAASTYERLLGGSNQEILDLAYTRDHQVVLWSRMSFDETPRFTRASAATLRRLASGTISQPGGEPGIRSAPATQYEHWSSDGRWKVSLSPEKGRLYLYQRDLEGKFVLEKFLRFP